MSPEVMDIANPDCGVLMIEWLPGQEAVNDQTREHRHQKLACGHFSCALASQKLLWVGTTLLHLRGCCILEKLEASRTPALSCCVRALGPHAADARQGMLSRRRSGRVCLAEEAKLVSEGRHGVVVRRLPQGRIALR